MTIYVNVRFNKISVRKSESYGIDGEPGNSAEWRLFLLVTNQSNATIQEHLWKKDGVRDNRTYDLNYDTVVALPANGLGVRITGWGNYTVGDDDLPSQSRSHTPEPGWHAGQGYKLTGKHNDFDYTVDYTIAYMEPIYSLLWNASTIRHEWLLNCSEEELKNMFGRGAEE
jgi:hypothetical protein